MKRRSAKRTYYYVVIDGRGHEMARGEETLDAESVHDVGAHGFIARDDTGARQIFAWSPVSHEDALRHARLLLDDDSEFMTALRRAQERLKKTGKAGGSRP